jgi:hypothetical protein
LILDTLFFDDYFFIYAELFVQSNSSFRVFDYDFLKSLFMFPKLRLICLAVISKFSLFLGNDGKIWELDLANMENLWDVFPALTPKILDYLTLSAYFKFFLYSLDKILSFSMQHPLLIQLLDLYVISLILSEIVSMLLFWLN